MPTAILNVPLHRITDVAALEQRHRMVMACMRLCFHDVVGELRPQQSDAWSVVTIGFDASKRVLEDAVAHLARQIGCGFISLLHENGSGASLGPAPEHLDTKHMLLPRICALGREVA